MLRPLRSILLALLLCVGAVITTSVPARSASECAPRQSPVQRCNGANLRIPSTTYSGPARVVLQPGTLPAWRWTSQRRWERQEITAGTLVWSEPFTADWAWTRSGNSSTWLAVNRSDLRANDGSTSALDDERTTVKLAGPYHASGRFIRDRFGRAVFFHGVNAVWKQAPYSPPSTLFGAPEQASYFDERDARLLADNGLNSVRLGVMWTGVEPRMNQYDDAYVLRMKRLAGMLGGHDVSVLVDSHQDMYSEAYQGEGFPDWARIDTGIKPIGCCGFPINYISPSSVSTWNAFWANRGRLQEQFRDQWTHVATSMRDLPNLIGYDVMNEPFAGSSYPRCVLPGGCRAFDTGPLQAMEERVAAGIRTVDATTPIWWEGNIANGSGGVNNVGAVRPLRDPGANTVLSFHSYCNLGGAVPGLSRANDPTCPGLHRNNFKRALTAAARNRSAAVLTEFGSSDDLVDIARVATLADANMTSWHLWHYGGWGDHTSTGDTTTAQGLFSNDLDRSTLKPAKANVLVRTYPQAVAGTPRSYDFAPDRRDRRFRLVFDIDPGIDQDTVIYVPVQRHYEGGYQVRVTGPARVTSAVGARLLTLRGTGARGTVAVTIVRTGH